MTPRYRERHRRTSQQKFGKHQVLRGLRAGLQGYFSWSFFKSPRPVEEQSPKGQNTNINVSRPAALRASTDYSDGNRTWTRLHNYTTEDNGQFQKRRGLPTSVHRNRLYIPYYTNALATPQIHTPRMPIETNPASDKPRRSTDLDQVVDGQMII